MTDKNKETPIVAVKVVKAEDLIQRYESLRLHMCWVNKNMYGIPSYVAVKRKDGKEKEQSLDSFFAHVNPLDEFDIEKSTKYPSHLEMNLDQLKYNIDKAEELGLCEFSNIVGGAKSLYEAGQKLLKHRENEAEKKAAEEVRGAYI